MIKVRTLNLTFTFSQSPLSSFSPIIRGMPVPSHRSHCWLSRLRAWSKNMEWRASSLWAPDFYLVCHHLWKDLLGKYVIILFMWRRRLIINITLDKVGQILYYLIPCGKTEGIFQKRVLRICSFVLGLPLAGYIAHTGDADDSDGSIPHPSFSTLH